MAHHVPGQNPSPKTVHENGAASPCRLAHPPGSLNLCSRRGSQPPREPAPFALGTFPVFLCETTHGIHYGFPVHSATGLKVAKHHHANEAVDPDTVARNVTGDDEALIRGFLAEHLPAGNGRMVSAKTCLYSMTPDGDFLLDRLPGAPQVIVASPCSGHGFKFAPVIGEIVADLVVDGATRRDIERFPLRRFG